jgi:hypothetical protein
VQFRINEESEKLIAAALADLPNYLDDEPAGQAPEDVAL